MLQDWLKGTFQHYFEHFLPIHSLFLSGWKEANHLHCLLQPFKIVTQIFLIFYLKIFLKEKKKETVGKDLWK